MGCGKCRYFESLSQMDGIRMFSHPLLTYMSIWITDDKENRRAVSECGYFEIGLFHNRLRSNVLPPTFNITMNNG